MKRIVLSLAFVFAAIALAEAKECVAPIDTSDFSDPGIGWGGGRCLTINELRTCVVSFGDNYYVVITVLQDLGQMEYSITNTSAGWYVDGEFNAVPGSYPIPISGDSGYYVITLFLQDGREYERLFNL